MGHGVLTWTVGNRDIPRSPPDGKPVLPVRHRNVGTVLPAPAPVPANAGSRIPVAVPAAVRVAVPRMVAVVAGRNIVPVPAEVAAAATSSAVAVVLQPASVVRRVLVPPSVSAVVEDIVEYRQDEVGHPKPSSIIKLGKGGEVKIIRE